MDWIRYIGLTSIVLGLITLYSYGLRVEYSYQEIRVPVTSIKTLTPGTYTTRTSNTIFKQLVYSTRELEANQTFIAEVNITELAGPVPISDQGSANCRLDGIAYFYIEAKPKGEPQEIELAVLQGNGIE